MQKIIFEVGGEDFIQIEIEVTPLQLRFLNKLKRKYDKEAQKKKYVCPSSIDVIVLKDKDLKV